MQIIHETESGLVAVEGEYIFVVDKHKIGSDENEIGFSHWKGVCLPVTRQSIYGKSLIAELKAEKTCG